MFQDFMYKLGLVSIKQDCKDSWSWRREPFGVLTVKSTTCVCRRIPHKLMETSSNSYWQKLSPYRSQVLHGGLC